MKPFLRFVSYLSIWLCLVGIASLIFGGMVDLISTSPGFTSQPWINPVVTFTCTGGFGVALFFGATAIAARVVLEMPENTR